jgi:hypothetical protein
LSVSSMDSLRKGGKHGPALDLIVPHITGEKTPRMPLGAELPPAVVAEFQAAIKSLPQQPQAPKKDEHWSWLLQNPTKTAPPQTKNSAWVRNPIDAFLLARLEKQGLTP